MRFRRWSQPTTPEDTSRERAALFAKQRRELAALPLFGDHIAAQQHNVETKKCLRAERWSISQRTHRDQRAASWRDARTRLFALDPKLRAIVRAAWRTCPYPADPSSFVDMLHQIEVARFSREQPPSIFHQPVQPHTTPNPTSFEEAFRKIGQRKVGGGPKTTPADEMRFYGNLGRGPLFLRSRVRLIQPNESFYTPSNMRLRDSFVGRSGHWIDLEVFGDCSDDDLALIKRLAQDADGRTVKVRRSAKNRSKFKS